MSDRDGLLERYRRLVLHELPRRAVAERWVVVADHCFGRIVLDNTVGACWYDAIGRGRTPAFARLDDDALARAVELAEQIAADGDPLLRRLNDRSLSWRGKAGPAGRPPAARRGTPAARTSPAACHDRRMRLDHVSYAAEDDGLLATTERLAQALGVAPLDGGVHPRFGTRNMLLPMEGMHYVEVVACLDHPASDKAPFGQAVRSRSQQGGGWLGWVVSVDDIAETARRLGREAVPGNRHRPDGVELRWQQVGVRGLLSDPQLPYVVQWEVPDELRPGADKASDVTIKALQIAGSHQRVTDWLGTPVSEPLQGVDVEWLAPHGNPGLLSVTFSTPGGDVRI